MAGFLRARFEVPVFLGVVFRAGDGVAPAAFFALGTFFAVVAFSECAFFLAVDVFAAPVVFFAAVVFLAVVAFLEAVVFFEAVAFFAVVGPAVSAGEFDVVTAAVIVGDVAWSGAWACSATGRLPVAFGEWFALRRGAGLA